MSHPLLEKVRAAQQGNPLIYGLAFGILLAVVLNIMPLLNARAKKRWMPERKNVLITGGSQGLGLALAELLASKGANVTIVARNVDKLEQALEKIKKASASPKTQSHAYISADVSTFNGAKQAVKKCSQVPDTLFCCAGGAKPGHFLEQEEQDFEMGLKMDYWTALASTHATARAMREAGVEGKIVLVSSLVGLFGLVGYSQYAPMKYAIRGLAETLRSEFLLYNITVHCYFPATILSPGFETEQLTKPHVLKEIEKSDVPQTPAVCAARLLQGVQKGHFFITSDWQTDLFRAATGGVAPGNGCFMDFCKSRLGRIALPIWRIFEADAIVKKHRTEAPTSTPGASSS
ncbi:NAD(P)-binding protein [Tilletiaria anomala UBC 951]|uniref:3-dehydrosphinganine reductase n=1 Tax=Tilletiaria anomala (strain ATCC 24038 / CBS 436.72 / UBC 951) TaxID=1037660 RepID=A0A066V772_TILAU|nr:NAD(P)-binding protein [Tilletiaria anomala UBC 951]KDN37592.1 NAD(P)-binding protein [Tilletiaria anomala UBC 951]